MRSSVVPDSWQMSSDLRSWTQAKGLTDKMIEEELERFRNYECDKPKRDFNRCWRTRILIGLKNGWITLPIERTYRTVEVISPEQQKRDAAASIAQMDKWRAKR